MADNLDIRKLIPTMSGKDKAKLILRDFHERQEGNKRGFLSEAEQSALTQFCNDDERREFNKVIDIYSGSIDTMIRIIELRQSFPFLYEQLGKFHLLLAPSVGLRMLKSVIANAVLARIKTEDEYAKCDDSDFCLVIKGGDNDYWTDNYKGDITLRKRIEVVLGFIDHLQIVEPRDNSFYFTEEISFSKNVGYVKDLVADIHQCACVIVTMRKIIDRINGELGFCTISNQEYQELLDFEALMRERIKRHNDLVIETTRDDSAELLLKLTKQEPKKCYKQMKDLQDYLIKEPSIDKGLYAEWERKIFKQE